MTRPNTPLRVIYLKNVSVQTEAQYIFFCKNIIPHQEKRDNAC